LKEDEKITGIATTLGEFHSNRIFVNPSFAHVDEKLVTNTKDAITRGVILSRGAIFENDGPVLFSIPPHSFDNVFPIYILQLGTNSNSTPEGYSILHFSTRTTSYDANLNSFQLVINQLPLEIVFYTTYLQQITENSGELIHIPNPGLGFEVTENFELAKRIFTDVRGNEPFLPSRPNLSGEDSD